MTTKRIVYTGEDGGAWVVEPNPTDLEDGRKPDESEDAYVARVMEHEIMCQMQPRRVRKLVGTRYLLVPETEAEWLARINGYRTKYPRFVVDKSTLPDKRWRPAWKHDGNGHVSIDIVAARAMRKAELLAAAQLSIGTLARKIDEQVDKNDKTKEKTLRDKRQALRDLPTTLDASLAALTTVAALDAFTPAILVDPDVV